MSKSPITATAEAPAAMTEGARCERYSTDRHDRPPFRARGRGRDERETDRVVPVSLVVVPNTGPIAMYDAGSSVALSTWSMVCVE